jgi:hypothetical protein
MAQADSGDEFRHINSGVIVFRHYFSSHLQHHRFFCLPSERLIGTLFQMEQESEQHHD